MALFKNKKQYELKNELIDKNNIAINQQKDILDERRDNFYKECIKEE